MRFHLYPIHWVANPHLDPEPFDPNLLPFQIMEGVRVEAVQFRAGASDLHRRNLGDNLTEIMERVRYAPQQYAFRQQVSDGRAAWDRHRSR